MISAKFTPAYATRIITCPRPGCGWGTSVSCNTSGPPKVVTAIALIGFSAVIDSSVSKGIDTAPTSRYSLNASDFVDWGHKQIVPISLHNSWSNAQSFHGPKAPRSHALQSGPTAMAGCVHLNNALNWCQTAFSSAC